jgi:heme A synthase
METPPINPWASTLAKVCVILTFVLLLAGAIVTTSGAGMSASQAPYIRPISEVTNTPWQQDPAQVLEHSHRYIAMLVGLLVGLLATIVWRNWLAFIVSIACMGLVEFARGHVSPDVLAHLRFWPAMIVFVALVLITQSRRGRKPTTEQWLALAAFCAACAQAVLGTLRVLYETAGQIALAQNIRTLHGVFAQAVLVVLVVLAARLSPVWGQLGMRSPHPAAAKVRRMAIALLFLYFCQLACGAYIRHRGLGLLISDWPQAQHDGGYWPTAWALGDGALRHKLMIHFLHTRILPILILGHVIGLAIGTAKRAAGEFRLTRLGWTLLALVGVQVILGAMVIWKGRQPHITNTHVITGALICATAALLMARAGRMRESASV